MDIVQYIAICGLLALYFSLRATPHNKWVALVSAVYAAISLLAFTVGFYLPVAQSIIVFWLALPLLKDIVSIYVRGAEFDITKLK